MKIGHEGMAPRLLPCLGMKKVLATLLAVELLAGCSAAAPAPISNDSDEGAPIEETSEGDILDKGGPPAKQGTTTTTPPAADDARAPAAADDEAEPPEPQAPPAHKTCNGSPENESNNSVATANRLPMNGVVCGSLSGTDVDFFTITARKVRLQFGVEADASLRITAPGSQQNIAGAATVTFGNGQPRTYVVEVTSRSGRDQIYGLKLAAE